MVLDYRKKDKKRTKVSREAKIAKLDWRFKSGKTYSVKPEPFPRVLKTRMKYAFAWNQTFSVGVSGARTFRLNSIHDPDWTGTGTTVAGHTQMAALYKRYLVTGAKIYISFSNPSEDGCRAGYRLRIDDDDPVASESLSEVMSKPLTYVSGINNTGSQKKNFIAFVRPWSLLGISKSEYMNNTVNYGSIMSSSPSPFGSAIGASMDVFALNPDTLVSGNIDVAIRIVYYVTLYDRKSLTMSA